jgi:hypothetical protein
MRRSLLAAFILLAACGNDTQQATADAPPGTTDSGPPADAPDTITDVTANITADTTWSGLIRIQNDITVAAGVKVTVEPRSLIEVAAGVTITVAGTIEVDGVKDGIVTIRDLVANENWNAFKVDTGTLNLAYAVMTGGGITVSNTGHVIASDTRMSTVSHDLLVISGGTIDIQYSWIGLAAGLTDTTHCDMHIQGGGPTVTVTHSNLSTAVYGVMLYTGTGVDFTYDNWFGNATDIDETVGPPVSADISNSWFEAGVPTYSGLTKTNMASSQVADAGPR